MVKLSRFQKFSVLSLLGLKKHEPISDLNKNLFFLNKNFKLNFFVINHFINNKGYFRHKKIFFFLLLLLRNNVNSLKLLRKFLARLNRPFVLSYFGYYLGFITDTKFKSWINSIKGFKVFKNSEHKKLSLKSNKKALTNSLVGVDYNVGLLKNARINLTTLKKLDPRFVKTRKIPKTWFIHLRKTYSNFMLTLTDFKGKVIVCHTSGSSGIKGRKKYKISQKAIEYIFKKFIPYFIRLGIKRVNVVTYKMRAPGLPILVNSLLSFGLSITSFNIRVLRAHNGVRKCKGR